VQHKRTFLFLEQLILKHKAHEKTIGIAQTAEGLDFHFKTDSHALRLVSFIKDHFVARMKHNKQLISHNEQNADYFYKYTNFVELAPICRDDLVILPPKVQKQLGGIGPLILVYKMTTCVHVVDIKTMRTHEIASPKYWESQFGPICSRERLTEFIVLNIEDVDFDVETSRAAARNKFRMVRVELARESEFGNSNRTFMVHTHLGEHINFNDTVLCYDLEQMTL
jgi:nonsense-mediated mRNA decay protein 3